MPREHRKRGRREETKRKREEEQYNEEEYPNAEPPAKRQRSPAEEEVEQSADYIPFTGEQDVEGFKEDNYDDSAAYGEFGAPQGVRPEHEFYGLLTEDEQAYFKRADNMLEVNQFAEAEEREIFMESVWREVNGKELRIANSQSCSRFLERLIRMSKPAVLKELFQKFQTHFLFLVQHRFASHCCEALFMETAALVTKELVAVQDPDQDDEKKITMESLFLAVVDELEGNLGYLLTDNFASHTLRVLLIVLSGKPFEDVSTINVLKSKKKENIQSTGLKNKAYLMGGNRAVPDSFQLALKKVISGTLGELDTNYLRTLATHPVGNPVLQLLLEVEFDMAGKQKAKDENSLFRRLLPDEVPEEGTTSASFIKGLLYDPVGSRLLETIIKHAPGKVFKAIYRTQFQDNIKGVLRNEVASYVAIRTMERLSHDSLSSALEQACPEIPTLMERGRTAVIKTMIEQSRLRKVDTRPIAAGLQDALGVPGSNGLLKMLQINSDVDEPINAERKAEIEVRNNGKRHASLLVQSMIEVQDPLRAYVLECFLAMDQTNLKALSVDKSATFALQSALTCEPQEKAFLRKTVPKFHDIVKDLAIDSVGSHVLDSIWNATESLFFLRERIAEELAANEVSVRESYHGRAVWRNWNMDVYKRSKATWVTGAKGGQDHSSNHASNKSTNKSAIELARERYAAKNSNPHRARQTKQTRPAVAAK